MKVRGLDYVDVLSERHILHESARVVEGCVGNTGWSASLRVAQALGAKGEYFLVDFDSQQLDYHRHLFVRNYPEGKVIYWDPHIEWVAHPIEELPELINHCDVMLFHNYFPVPKESFFNREPINPEDVTAILKKIVAAGPKVMAFYLPNFKDPEGLAVTLESLSMKCELVDGVHYAGDLEGDDPQKWIGKALIATMRTDSIGSSQ